MVDEVEKDVDDYEGSSAPYPCRAVDHNRARVIVYFHVTVIRQSDSLQETQHGPRFVRYPMVWPRLEMELRDGARLCVFLLFTTDEDLSQNVVRIGGLLQSTHVDPAAFLGLIQIRPVLGTLVLEDKTERDSVTNQFTAAKNSCDHWIH